MNRRYRNILKVMTEINYCPIEKKIETKDLKSEEE